MTLPERKVFISYAHEGPDLSERVLGLSNRLRQEGVPCVVDQYFESPPEGWPLWMERQVESAASVLITSTEEYSRRFRGDSPTGVGRGVKWEGAVIRQSLYERELSNTKFIPIVFDRESLEYVPTPLRGATVYSVWTEDGYDALYRRLTHQPAVRAPALGPRRALPPLQVRTPDPSQVSASARSTIIFDDAVEPDRVTLASAADALTAGGAVAVAWPSSTEQAYASVRARRPDLRERFLALGVVGEETIERAIDHFDGVMHDTTLYYDYAVRRIPIIWEEIGNLWNEGHATAFMSAARAFLILCNVKVLGGLRALRLEGDPELIPEEFSEPLVFLRSAAGSAAFDTREQFYGVETWLKDEPGSVNVWAPASVAETVRHHGGYSMQHAAAWLIPWFELQFVGTSSVANYDPRQIEIGRVINLAFRPV